MGQDRRIKGAERMSRAWLLLVILGAFPLSAQGRPPAWDLTLEARLARRFDPLATRGRIERALAARRGAQAMEGGASPALHLAGRLTNFIDGRHDPELFLPYELFRILVRDGFAPDPAEREVHRQRLAGIIMRFTEPERFWESLEIAAHQYLENQRSEDELARSLQTELEAAERQRVLKQIESLQAPQCGLSRDAIEAAAARIGRVNLDRVLYEGIAPGLTLQETEQSNPAALRFIAGGCR
jgi:hypothetical protein